MIENHEGFRSFIYQCPSKKWTIGYGRNLEDRGISELEAQCLLDNDIVDLNTELSNLTTFQELSDVRKAIILDMTYNIGYRGIMGFKKMWNALAQKDYQKAYFAMLDSKWATQVPHRAKELAKWMLEDKIS